MQRKELLVQLNKKLEEERLRLYKVIEAKGLSSPDALKQSRIVDELVNKINRLQL